MQTEKHRRPCRPPQHQLICFRPVSGLARVLRIAFPSCRGDRAVACDPLHSLTVAGAVSDLRLVTCTDFPFHRSIEIERHLKRCSTTPAI